MKVLGRIGNIIMNILIFIVFICLIFVVYSTIQLKVLNKEYTDYFGYTYFEILTGSMKEEIDVNDYVFVKITKDVKKDDIISFYSDDKVVTHRVIEINDKEVITQGDANNVADLPITKKDIIGKVVFIGHSYGKYVKVATEPIVFIPFFITIFLFNLALSKSEGDENKNEKNEK